MIITLDGPSKSGKSTLAGRLAKEKDFFYLNSGLLYRYLAYILTSVYGYNEDTLLLVSEKCIKKCFVAADFSYVVKKHAEFYTAAIYYKKKDITNSLIIDKVSEYASILAQHSKVRLFLNRVQKSMVKKEENAVIEGRDSGTAVFPNANKKFFIIASCVERAQRLFNLENKNKEEKETIFFAQDQLLVRDKRDSERAHDPLKKAANAIVIDTTKHSIEESLSIILQNL